MRTAEDILKEAIERYKPVASYVGFTGGGDSTTVTHWAMTHVPGCQVFLANTGIGIERARQHVRDECRRRGWPLTEIRAKEDCGQDYDELVKERGFPGPDQHKKMYDRLKGRCVEMLVRNTKRHRMDKVMILSGIRHDESLIRMGYSGREINTVGAQVWVNPIYWWSKQDCRDYMKKHGLEQSAVSKKLGMSGECGCGAYAHRGELALWRAVDPEFADRIERLQDEVLARGFTWGWDGRPPAGGHNPNQQQLDPAWLCGSGCFKSAVVAEESDR